MSALLVRRLANRLCRQLLRATTVSHQAKKPKFSVVKPATLSPLRSVPDHIAKPKYADTAGQSILNMLFAETAPKSQEPEIKTAEQIQGMKDACKLAKELLLLAKEHVKVGVTTDELDRLVHEECIRKNAYPSPLLYRGYPKSICTSVNNVACHGIPDSRALENGDIVNIDVTVSSFWQLDEKVIHAMCKLHKNVKNAERLIVKMF